MLKVEVDVFIPEQTLRLTYTPPPAYLIKGEEELIKDLELRQEFVKTVLHRATYKVINA